MRTLTTLGLLFALTPVALAGPPGLAPRAPDAPHGPRPPRAAAPHVLDEVREREPEILAWLAETDPDSHARLLRVKERDPRSYMGHLVRAARLMERSSDDPGVVARHQAMRELERSIRELARDWPDQDPKTQKATRSEIEVLAGELFDLKQEERRSALEAIRARASELEREIEERDGDRKGTIGDWVDELLEGPADL